MVNNQFAQEMFRGRKREASKGTCSLTSGANGGNAWKENIHYLQKVGIQKGTANLKPELLQVNVRVRREVT